MTVTLTGTGGLFTRLGKIQGSINNVNGFRGDDAPASATTWGSGGPEISCLDDSADGIDAQYASARQDLADGLYTARSSLKSSMSVWQSYLRDLARRTLVEMVNDDTALDAKTVQNAMTELITQMEDNSDSVDANSVAASSAAGGSNNGDGVVVVSVKGGTGLSREHVFAETLTVRCTSDSQTGGATEGSETFSVTGDGIEGDTLSQDWPRGSGASTSLTAQDASSTSQLVTNGDFEDFTSNAPDDWTIAVGAAATDIFAAGSGDAYEGSNGLEFTGTGAAPLSEIYQSVTLKPNTVYMFNCYVKKSASLAAGVLRIDLHDGSSTIADDQSTDNAATIAHGTVTTSFASFSGTFITPRVLPATTRIRVKITTALTSGESLFVDHLCMVEARELYTGGPYAQAFSGATKFVKDDKFTITVTNDGAGEFQQAFERLFGMRTLGLQLPSDSGGSETIDDALVA